MTYSSRAIYSSLLSLVVLFVAGCQTETSAQKDSDSQTEQLPGPGELAELPDKPDASASSEFWDYWGDGTAELNSYRGEIVRYGEPRRARAVLVYVTEPHDRRRWIKDDAAEGSNRVEVLKLNRTLKFQTGTYPYSVMTSTFAPVDDWGRTRFQPTKITLTSHEWCGNVFHGLWPGTDRFLRDLETYFADEKEGRDVVVTPEDTLYQDALPIQLRELDGKFNGEGDWTGHVVPSLWHSRRNHEPLRPVEASIERSEQERDGERVTRFVLEYGDTTVTYEFTEAHPHRMVRWKHSNGSHLRLVDSARKPYWRLNKPGDESHRKDFGLPTRTLSNWPPRGEQPSTESE